MKKRNYVVFSFDYDENVGGIIALHRLCDLLNKEGTAAYLWPYDKPCFDYKHSLKSIFKDIRYRIRRKRFQFKTCPQFNTPIATHGNLKNAIVIYPEVVNGNPLRAERVIRWLLNKPGFFNNEINYSANDLFFYYNKAFDNKQINPFHYQLQTIYVRDDIYKNKHYMTRNGSCYLMRKGKSRDVVHDLTDSVCIDEMSHEEIAEIFNRCEYFISYDLYTMYSRYAVLCGCTSIVIPYENLSKEAWMPDKKLRHGIAYGFDDIDFAKKTSKYVLDDLKKEEKQANESVKAFVQISEKYFKDLEEGTP